MNNIGIILGSTRPGRKGEAVATWVMEHAAKRTDARYELVDLATVGLPLLDEPVPPSMNQYTKDHTRRWGAQVAAFDGYVFVTAEYNHGIPGALKNAIDFVYHEWTNKAAGFVGYGSAGGVRAVEQLRLVMGELQIADVRSAVALTLAEDWEQYKTFKPRPHHEKALATMLDQVNAWAGALAALRMKKAA